MSGRILNYKCTLAEVDAEEGVGAKYIVGANVLYDILHFRTGIMYTIVLIAINGSKLNVPTGQVMLSWRIFAGFPRKLCSLQVAMYKSTISTSSHFTKQSLQVIKCVGYM